MTDFAIPDALAINCVFTPNTSFAVLSTGLTSSAIPLTVVSFPCIAATSLISVPRRGHKNWDRRPLRSQSNNVAAGCFFPRIGCFTCTHKCVHGFPHMLSSPCIQFFRVEAPHPRCVCTTRTKCALQTSKDAHGIALPCVRGSLRTKWPATFSSWSLPLWFVQQPSFAHLDLMGSVFLL